MSRRFASIIVAGLICGFHLGGGAALEWSAEAQARRAGLEIEPNGLTLRAGFEPEPNG